MKNHFFIFTALLLTASAMGKPQLLSTSCATAYEILNREGRVLERSESQPTLKLVHQTPAKLAEHMQASEPETLLKELEEALLIRWQLVSAKPDHIPSHYLPTDGELAREYPHLKGNVASLSDETKFGFQRELLEGKVTNFAKDFATQLGERYPQHRPFFFRSMMDQLNLHGDSWYHQTRVDQVIDRLMGMRSEEVTRTLQKQVGRENPNHSEEIYEAASASMLLTPYREIHRILSLPDLGLKPGSHIVDIGAGMGRLGMYVGIMRPDLKFTGYEIVPERVGEGQRLLKQLGLDTKVDLIEQDLSDPNFKMADADLYYAFNPVSGETFDKLLEDLRQRGIQRGKPYKIVLFGPAPFVKLDAQPWLKKLSGPEIPEHPEFGLYELVPSAVASGTIKTNWNNIQGKKTPDDLQRAIPTGNVSLSFLAPTYLNAWHAREPFEVIRRDGAPVLKFSDGLAQQGTTFVEPHAGSPQKKVEIIKGMLEENPEASFHFVSPKVAGIFNDPGESGYAVFTDPHYSDYVYPLPQLRELSANKKLRDRKNQLKRFNETFPDIRTTAGMREDDVQELADIFLRDWTSRQTHPGAIREGRVSERLNANLGENAARLALMRDGKVVGFALAEVVEMDMHSTDKTTAIIYTQKTDGQTPNTVVKLNYELVDYIFNNQDRFGSVEFVNLMSDEGVEGLRRFKRDYSPIPDLGTSFGIRRVLP